MQIELRHFLVLVALVAACTSPRRLAGQESVLSRYGIVEELVLADSSEAKLTNRPVVRNSDFDGSASFIVVFVVDTFGKVEMPSVSFRPDVAGGFRSYTCRILRLGEYAPVKRDGRLQRALVVAAWGLTKGGTPSAVTVSAEPLRALIKQSGIVDVLPAFAKQPHCDG